MIITTFFSCPTCREIFRLPSEGIKYFPRNHRLESAIEELKKVPTRFLNNLQINKKIFKLINIYSGDFLTFKTNFKGQLKT